MNSTTAVKITSITVTAVQPERADTRRLDYLRATANVPVENHYYIVKLYLETPLAESGDMIRLFVGQEAIPKYSGFIGGLYFKVYDPEFFDQHEGDTIYVSIDGSTLTDTHAVLPPRPRLRALRAGTDLPRNRALSSAIDREASDEVSLPLKDDVLKQ